MYVRLPLSLRHVEGLLHERGIDVRHQDFRAWMDRFGPGFGPLQPLMIQVKHLMSHNRRTDVYENDLLISQRARDLCLWQRIQRALNRGRIGRGSEQS